MELATVKDRAERSLQHLDVQGLEHRHGRKLEQLAKHLPVDTPLDRRRRLRRRRRAVEVGLIIVAVAGAAGVYLALRHRGSDPEQPSPEQSNPELSEPDERVAADAVGDVPSSNGSTKVDVPS